MAAVTVAMSGDDAKLRAAHERLLAQQQKLLDKYTAIANGSKTSSESALKGLVTLGAQYVTINGAMQLANALSAEFAQLQQVSLEKTKGLAAAKQETTKNLQGMSFLQKEAL